MLECWQEEDDSIVICLPFTDDKTDDCVKIEFCFASDGIYRIYLPDADEVGESFGYGVGCGYERDEEIEERHLDDATVFSLSPCKVAVYEIYTAIGRICKIAIRMEAMWHEVVNIARSIIDENAYDVYVYGDTVDNEDRYTVYMSEYAPPHIEKRY